MEIFWNNPEYSIFKVGEHFVEYPIYKMQNHFWVNSLEALVRDGHCRLVLTGKRVIFTTEIRAVFKNKVFGSTPVVSTLPEQLNFKALFAKKVANLRASGLTFKL